MKRLLIIVMLLLLPMVAHGAASLRPYSGCAVLSLEPQPGGERATVVLYQEPGLARIGEVDASLLPRLAGSATEPLVAVSARKGEWVRLSYDDAGRDAWVKQERSWRYLPWQEFLPGRRVAVLPGLKKGYYAVRNDPSDSAAQTAVVKRDQEVRVLRVEEDWALLEAPSGWFRWRDNDGRLTVSVQREL